MKYLLLIAALVLAMCSCNAEADLRDVKTLTAGVSEIAAPGIPGPLCVYGKDSFAVVAGGIGKGMKAPVVAAVRIRKGRAVAFGHDGYFGYETLMTADTGRLLLNAVNWTGNRNTSPKIAVHASADVLKYLNEHGIKAEALDGKEWYKKLREYDVLCSTPWDFDMQAVDAVLRHVKNGGGFVSAALGWGYLQLNPNKTINDLPGNLILSGYGIMWADGMLDRTTSAGFSAATPPTDCHALTALNSANMFTAAKSARDPRGISQAVDTITRASMTLPNDDRLFLPGLRTLRKKLGRSGVIPTENTPVTSEQPLERLAITLDLQDVMVGNPKQKRRHPASVDFPGEVSRSAERVSRNIEIDTAVPGWHSTGLYAAAGDTLKIETGLQEKSDLQVRIGSHSDTLWHLDTWKRMPDICKTAAIESKKTVISSPFGGLIYIVVPEECKLGKVSLKIGGAVQAPRYVLGDTATGAWKNEIRNYPGPWAELETSKVILTLPSEAIRKLDDPEKLMMFWDKVLDACADLADWPRERPRPERYVADRQISAGYMHSGYPIMTWLDVIHHEVDLESLKSNAKGMNWGFFHEMGHNHQSGDWTFEGTGEVTVNLFSLYVLETVCGIVPRDTRPQMSTEGMANAYKKYAEAGKSFETWKSDPFLALAMYVQIKDQFGWDAYKKVFAEYRKLPDNERPKNDDGKRDQWLVRLSRTVGRNLGPFFDAWGIPTSKTARDTISELPVWIPEL